ncbi:hypothetical protein ACFP81_07790 [Deinococcus lacus]|uniref:Uncharacterized protein n=1 Tax=Deinococcus lacus TaxID=392561 RepID=A0ABW1YF80_9DEIO
MTPTDLPTQATLHHLLIREGFTSGAEVVAWADGWILRLDSWSEELTDISLSGGNGGKILSALGRLALPTLSQQAFGHLCGLLLARLEADAGELSAVNSLLWRVHYDGFHGVRPLEFEPTVGLCWFHEWENLIPDCLQDMTPDELRREVTDFLRFYAPPAS